MGIIGILLVALSASTIQAAPPRFGVAIASGDRVLVAIDGAELETGTPLTLVAIHPPQQVYRGAIDTPRQDCVVFSRALVKGLCYGVATPEPVPVGDLLAVAVVGAANATVSGGTAELEIPGYPHKLLVAECASTEGIHLSVWDGVPFKGNEIWHLYWYLGYDVEPSCPPVAPKKGASNNRMQLTAPRGLAAANSAAEPRAHSRAGTAAHRGRCADSARMWRGSFEAGSRLGATVVSTAGPAPAQRSGGCAGA